jgi:hypothetical protein
MFKETFDIIEKPCDGIVTLKPANSYNHPLLRKIISGVDVPIKSNIIDAINFLRDQAFLTKMELRVVKRESELRATVEIIKREPCDIRPKYIDGAINSITEFINVLGLKIPTNYSPTNEKLITDLLEEASRPLKITKSTQVKIDLIRLENGPHRITTGEEPDDLPGPFAGVSVFGTFGPNFNPPYVCMHSLRFPFHLSTIDELISCAREDIRSFRRRNMGCKTCVAICQRQGSNFRLWKCPIMPGCPSCRGEGIFPD